MFETIPSLYWMIIIAVPVGFFTFILYQLGMIIKDSREVVRSSSRILKEAEVTVTKANGILEDVESMVSVTKATVYEVNKTVITPVRGIAQALTTVSAFISGLKK
jgi:hypothetical protein